MEGITLEELRERLSWGHDAEFTYHGEEYVIQQEDDEAETIEEINEEIVEKLIEKLIEKINEETNEETNMVIWKITPKAYCIAKHSIPADGQIPDSCIDAILNDKCFDGKSFMDIEAEVRVDAIL